MPRTINVNVDYAAGPLGWGRSAAAFALSGVTGRSAAKASGSELAILKKEYDRILPNPEPI